MRRIAMVLVAMGLGCAVTPALASAASAVVERGSAHVRPDGRVELFVHVRPAHQGRLAGRVHVSVVDRNGRQIAAGGDRRRLSSGTDLRYHVILARSKSARVAAAMRRDGHLRLRVDHRGTLTRGGAATAVEADAVALDADVLDTDITISAHPSSPAVQAPGVMLFGNTPYAGCLGTPNVTAMTANVVCTSAAGAAGTVDVQWQSYSGLTSGSVLGGTIGGAVIDGGELTGSVGLQQWPGGYDLDIELWGAVSTG